MTTYPYKLIFECKFIHFLNRVYVQNYIGFLNNNHSVDIMHSLPVKIVKWKGDNSTKTLGEMI